MSERPSYDSLRAPLLCDGERHEIVFEDGELRAPNHGDPEGERALAALGGASCACVAALSAWSRRRHDPGLLVAMSRGANDPIISGGTFPGPRSSVGRAVMTSSGRGVMTSPGRAAMGSWVSYAPLSGPGGPGGARAPGRRGVRNAAPPGSLVDDVLVLSGLGRAIAARLAGAVTAELIGRLDEDPGAPGLRSILHASLYGRSCEAIRRFLGEPDATVELEVVDPGDERMELVPQDFDIPTTVHLALSFRWVTDVWALDLAVVAGRFVLGLLAASEHRLVLSAVGAGTDRRETLSVELG